VEGEAAQFDLTLSIEEADTELALLWEYNRDLFNETTIARMATHFHRLLEALVTEPDRPLGAAPLVTDRERQQLLSTWNATAAAYPDTACVHQLIDAQVRRTPDAVAVVCGSDQLTYAALNQRANQLAHRLRALGVGPDRLVAVCLDRSLDLLVAVLGILKAGGADVPLDPTYPRQRLAFILPDAPLPPALTHPALRPLLPETTATLLCLDREASALAAEPAGPPDLVTSPDDLIYVIYTSGSTGRPKGVRITHRSVVNYTHDINRAITLSPSDRFLQFASAAFDASAEEFFSTRIAGAAIVMR